jgi:hypothetical protein
LPVTVVVFVTHVKSVEGAVPVSVATNVSPLSRTPSAQERSFPVTVQPGVVVATLVTPAGTESVTKKPELFPGPKFVTVCVHVIAPPGETAAGPVFVIPRSTLAVPVHAAPSLLELATGPVKLPSRVKVGVPPGLATASS